MSDRPVEGAVTSPGVPEHDFSGTPGSAVPAQTAPSGSDGAGPAGISDFGRFDWFAESEHFGDPAGGQAGGPRASWLARARAGGPSTSGPGTGSPGAGRRWRRTVIAGGLALACALGGGIIGGVVALRSTGDQADPTYSLGTVPAGLAARPASSVAGIAARDTPSVVMIKVNNGQGTGSGFIIKGGYIITDNHVVTLDGLVSNPSLRVYFSNGTSAPGLVVGRDPYSDIAVIKAEGVSDLPALTLGDSASVAVGDPVLAIGSPLGLADTVTSGIVSALDRPVQPGAATGTTPQVFFDAIQTDAPINPGNSGGPLVNARGQVIGVDAAIDTLGDNPITGSQGGSIGLGFAIPVNQARRVIVQLIRTGHATHSTIGANLNENYTGNGAQIAPQGGGAAPAVTPGGPAARAGLRAGDVITKLGRQSVASAYALLDAVRSLPPGSRVSVTFLRNGQQLRSELALGSAGS